MKQAFSKTRFAVGTIVRLGLAGFFAWFFYVRFWKWRECITETTSSCVTPDGTNLVEGGALWVIPAVLFGVLGVRRLLKSRHAQQGAKADGPASGGPAVWQFVISPKAKMAERLKVRVKFFSERNGGREKLPQDLLSSRSYRPHLVVGNPNQKRALLTNRTEVPEGYLGVVFVAQDGPLEAEKQVSAEIETVYSGVNYSSLKKGRYVYHSRRTLNCRQR